MPERPSPEQPEDKGGEDYEALREKALLEGQHPYLVNDEKKAELMAHATDEFETKVVEHRRKALEEAHKVDGHGDFERVEAMMDHVGEAKDARDRADAIADAVGYVYDETKDL